MSGGFNIGKPYGLSRQGPHGKTQGLGKGMGAKLHYDNYQVMNAVVPVAGDITSWDDGITGGLVSASSWNGGGKYLNQFTVFGGKRQAPSATYVTNLYYDVNEWTTTSGQTIPSLYGRQGMSFATAEVGGITYQYLINGFDNVGTRQQRIYRQNMSNPANAWTHEASTITGAVYGRACWDKGLYIYFSYGNTVASGYGEKRFWRLTLSDGTITQMANIPTTAGNTYGNVFCDGSYMYLAGGYDGTIRGGTFRFDPSDGATGSWSDMSADMPSATFNGTFDEYGVGMVVVGGSDGTTTGACHIYDATANTWSTQTAISPARGGGVGFTLKAADISSGTTTYTRDTFFTGYGLLTNADDEVTAISWGINT